MILLFLCLLFKRPPLQTKHEVVPVTQIKNTQTFKLILFRTENPADASWGPGPGLPTTHNCMIVFPFLLL